jgi:hypothetical protein
MHPPIEAAFTQHRGHQACRADKAKGFFYVPTKISGGYQDNCHNLGVTGFSALWLFMVHTFKYIVKKYVYCNGFINHGQSFVYVS